MPLMPAASAASAVTYINEDGASRSCTNYTVVTSTIGTTWSDGWYVVNSSVEIASRVSVSGHVRLILVDGCSLKINEGIEVNDPNRITIYGQSANSGKLTCGALSYCAAIGGNKYQGDNQSASRSYGDITINGGTIEVTGGYWAAGIGAGTTKDYDRKTGGTITINGGNIKATGGRASAGIGGGYSSSTGTITINGGTINATAGDAGGEMFATAIGGGLYNDFWVSQSDAGTVNINGGRITTTTYDYSPYGNRPGVGTATGGTYLTINLSWTKASDRYAFSVPRTLSVEAMSDGCYGNKNYLKSFEKGWENNRQILVPHKGYNFHAKKAATCTENGYSRDCYQCPECGHFFTDNTVPTECAKSEVYLNPLGHNMEQIAAEAATFTSNGHIEYYHCKRCNKYFKDSAAKFEITLAETVTTAVTYLDENGVEKTLTSGTSVTADRAVWKDGWYVVDHDVTINDRVSVNGTVSLLLLNGKTLTAKNGIEVKNGNTFKIYAQSTDKNVMGRLVATLDEDTEDCSTIGGSRSIYHYEHEPNEINGKAGTIVINGGYLDVASRDSYAIGDGEVEYEDKYDDDRKFFTETTFNLTINGGIIDLNRRDYIGISDGSIGSKAKGVTITINGGKITCAEGINIMYGSISINDTGRPLELTTTFLDHYYYSFKISGKLMLNDGTGTEAILNVSSGPYSGGYTYYKNFSGKTLVNYRTVTIDDCGATTAEKIPFGTLLAEPSHSSRTGYEFAGWAANDTFYDFSTAVTSDTTITAKYRNLTHLGYTSNYTPDGSANKPYIISTNDGWNAFCDALQDNLLWNRFSGKTVKLGANIGAKQPVSSMAGSAYHDFCGTFDGNGMTLTVNYGSANSPVTDDYVAPFRYTETGCVIERLHVTGNIYTSAKYAGGLIADHYSTGTIRDCRSSVTIHSSVVNNKNNDGTHGGFVGLTNSSSNLTIEGCVFDGKLLTNATSGTNRCGGFVGWKSNSGSVTITNSLYAPATIKNDETEVGTDDSYTFVRNGSVGSNCYYTRTLGDAQGTAPRTVTAGEGVTIDAIAPVGVATATYGVSGITAYTKGITRAVGKTTTFYYGQGDYVNLTLSKNDNPAPAGYQLASSYSASAGTLTGNDTDGYTLTMPNANVIISIPVLSDGQQHSISYMKADGSSDIHDAIALDETMTTLAAGQWYYVGKDINYTKTVTLGSGEVTLVLGDNKTMYVGTDQNKVSGNGLHGEGCYLTVYGQTLDDTTAGNLSISTSGEATTGIKVHQYDQNSGNVTIRSSYQGISTSSGPFSLYGGKCDVNSDNQGIRGKALFILGGKLDAIGGTGEDSYGVSSASFGINLGFTNATDYIHIDKIYKKESVTNIGIVDGQSLKDEDGNVYKGYHEAEEKDDFIAAINGKTLVPHCVLIDINGLGIRTYANSLPLDFSAVEGLTAYIASGCDKVNGYSQLTMIPVTKVPAATGLLLKGPKGAQSTTYEVPLLITDADDVSSNMLVGLTEATEVPTSRFIQMDENKGDYYYTFILANGDHGINWYRLAQEGNYTPTLKANSAYLLLPEGMAPLGNDARSLSMVFESETTGVSRLTLTPNLNGGEWYDLNGRKLDEKPTRKGLYIFKGNRIMIK